MKLRVLLYQKGFLSSRKPDAFLISVGNLSMGGSGKTPVVIYLSKLLLKNGYNAAAVSRGYKGKASHQFNTVSDGTNIFMEAEQSGDEPRLIAESVSGLVVLTGKKRIHPCTYAVQNYNCNTIILDDAFQHLGVKRDIDLVLFNADTLFQNMNVFPGGYLREPLSALQRADSFIITGCNASNFSSVEKFCSYLAITFPNIPVFRCRHIAQGLVDIKGNSYSLDHITRPVLAFCGIASPSRFKDTLLVNSITPADFLTFNDHQEYSPATFKEIEKKAAIAGCDTLITTTKDMVKLIGITTSLQVFALQTTVIFDQSFDNFILNSIAESRASNPA